MLLSSMGCECDCESYIIILCVLYVALIPGPISQLSLLHAEMIRELGDKYRLCCVSHGLGTKLRTASTHNYV